MSAAGMIYSALTDASAEIYGMGPGTPWSEYTGDDRNVYELAGQKMTDRGATFPADDGGGTDAP